MRAAIAFGIFLGLIGCGEVTSVPGSGTGNDVPAGPAIAAAGSGNDCTRPTGAGVDATVTPGTGGYPGQGEVIGTPQQGLDPSTPPCFDFTAQVLTSPGALLTTIPFVIKDGVVQATADARVRIVTQWFLWYEPSQGVCQAGVDAVVEVTIVEMPTCAAQVNFGAETDYPIYSYQAGT